MSQLHELEQVEQTQPITEKRVKMTDAEFQHRLDEDTHAEWVDGEAILFMPPNTRHQRLVHFLNMLIGTFLHVFRYGELFAAPYAMRISPHGSIREPDILFVSNERSHFIGETRLEGPADLVIEIISKESAGRDRSDKFDEYQSGGVREYWVIDPRPGNTRADFWILAADGRYRPVLIDEDGTYLSPVLPNFKINVDSLLAEQLPDPFTVAAEMVGKEALWRSLDRNK